MASIREKGEASPFRLGKAVQGAALRFRRLGDENLARREITFSQLRVIAYVAAREKKGESVYQRDLEEVFDIRRSSVTSVLQNLEKRGILKRLSDSEDARVKLLSLTEKGRELDVELKNYIHSLEEEVLKGFSPEEKELLEGFFLRIFENLDEIERNRL